MHTYPYQNVEFQSISSAIKNKTPLFVTATRTETEALHRQLVPIANHTHILKITKDNATYYVGQFGNFVIVHVECGNMGSSPARGSTLTISNAITLINPQFVLMLGIAFGINIKKQKIGDVLISETIMPYELQRISKDVVVSRNVKPEASLPLKNIFQNVYDWQYMLPTEETAKLISGDILSGEKLIDNIDYRKELERVFPTAIGGEMEGTGLYAACQDKNVQ